MQNPAHGFVPVFTFHSNYYFLLPLSSWHFFKKAHPLLIAGIILFYASKDLKWSKGPFFLAFMSQNGGNLRQKKLNVQGLDEGF